MKNLLFRLWATCLLLVVVCFSSMASSPPTASAAPDHYIVEYKKVFSYTKDSLNRFWKQKHIPQIMVPVRYDVDMYDVTYKGIWLDSTYIKARGVLYVPKGTEKLAEMVYDHGTRISVDMGPGIQDLEQLICMMYSVDGYISMFPYYYGLGGGEKEHVYQDSYTEAMATIYMVKACREIYSKIGANTSGQLFITGYSQGGHAAMATHKMLETGAFPDVKLTASAPMSGAYDMTGVQAQTMYKKYSRPHYLPYLILSYQYAYHLWPGNVYDVFKAPYNTQMEKVFAQPRHFDYGYVDSILPKIPSQMVNDSLIERFRSDTSFAFSKKLKENCLSEWVPKIPMQMCACYADDEVMCQNTQKTYEYMHARTNVVHKRVFGKHLSHNPCAPFAILYSKTFFDGFRKGKAHPEKYGKGRKMLLAIAIAQANGQAKRHLKRTGKLETDALASRSHKK